MIPVYTKIAILGAGALAAIGAVMFLQKQSAPALLPTTTPSVPKASSLFASTVDNSPMTPSGQTQAQVDAITAQNDTELAAFLDQELASF